MEVENRETGSSSVFNVRTSNPTSIKHPAHKRISSSHFELNPVYQKEKEDGLI